MKIFESIQNYFAIAGISIRQTTNMHAFNIKSVTVGFGFGVSFISCTMFFFYEASGFEEFAGLFFLVSTAIFSTFCFINLVWKRANLFKFIKSLENFIEKRE